LKGSTRRIGLRIKRKLPPYCTTFPLTREGVAVPSYEAKPADEYPHTPSRIPDWKESYWFGFYDPPSRICALLYIAAYPNVPKRDFLVVLLTHGDTDVYSNTLPVGGKLGQLSDNKLTYTLIKPNELWHVHFDDRRRYLDLDFTRRFPTVRYDPKQSYVKGVLEQEHYEQPCLVKGTVRLADGTRHEVYCLGHRDHSWGRRDYASIDDWYWVEAQFPSCAVNLIRLRIGSKLENAGFVSTVEETLRVTDLEVETRYEKDGVTPRSFTYRFTDETTKRWLLKSSKLQTYVYPPRQAKPGYETIIYEIVSSFRLQKQAEVGYGIAEQLASRRTT
jgi:hypothetical protein